MRDMCPRAGGVQLTTERGDSFWLPTRCKTWGCNVCRESLASLVKARMIYGLTHSTGSLFITVTYRMGGPATVQTVQSVERDLRSLWRKLRERCRWKRMSYVKVPELTKAGQVHLHLLVTGVEFQVASCRRDGELMRSMKARQCSTGCVQHELMRLWQEVTGDSFIVDASRVRNPAKCAAYVAKYVVKGFHMRYELEALGFKRRFAFSRNWPGVGKMRLAFTDDPGWETVERVELRALRIVDAEVHLLVLEGGDIVPRLGQDVTEIVYGRRATRELKKAIRRVSGA